MTNITPYTESQSLVPPAAEIRELFKLSETLCSTNFVPDSFRGKPAETLAAILYGRELGIGPMQALQQINVIKGKPSASPELMRALVRRAGHSIATIESTPETCVLEGKRADDGTIERSTFTIADARTAGLAGGGAWKTYPKAMLLARATSQLCRSLFADVISGISYTPEELTSIDAPTIRPLDVAPVQLDPDLVPAAIAKRQLLDACGGDVDRAKAIWNGRGMEPLTDADVDALIEQATNKTPDDLFGEVEEAEIVEAN